MSKRLRSAGGWLFRNRQTGRITVVQAPNSPLLVWLGATILRWLVHPASGLRAALTGVAFGALVIWAGDEVLRGVNPWRRMLGGGMLAFLAISWGVRS